MSEDKASKTEQPTAKRQREAREKGQISKSMEINTFAVLLSGLFVFFFAGSYMFSQLKDIMTHFLTNAHHIPDDSQGFIIILTNVIWQTGAIMAPMLATVFIVAFLANFAQVGPLFSWQVLEPKFSKLNPIKGLGRLFSKRSLLELVKSIGKIAIIAAIAYSTIKSEIQNFIVLGDMAPAQIGYFVLAVAFEIFMKTCWALAVLAVLDFAFQKWQGQQDLKMTKEEIKEEMKQTEGDPLIKSRIRSAQREAARRRMMAKVPEADVVVTNPTHIAVALLYDASQNDAPMLVAKGRALLAERIKAIAKEHNIPIMEDKPLAQALFKSVEVGETIPLLFYQAVAEILAYVYRLKGKNVHGQSDR